MPVQDTSNSSRRAILATHSESHIPPASSGVLSEGPVELISQPSSEIAPDDKTVISKRPAQLPAATPPMLGAFPSSESLVGMRLEHYELIELVGGGGMGAVFRARDMRLGRTVAVKILLRDRNDEETIRRFHNEAQNAARLDHPNIARVYYVGEDRGWNFIVFEFIEGENLRDVVDRQGPLRLEDALSYTLQIAEAIAHASSRGVVHRDIKPSNVLLTAGNVVKLVDMGLARLHQASASDELTASGVTLGTFDYISPEQARDPRDADVRSDIYSLGCTLYLMLTGRPPFPDGTALQKLIRHSTDDPADIRSLRADVPTPVAALLTKMLAKQPSRRPQSGMELVAEIVAVARQIGLTHLLPSTTALPAPAQASQAWQRVAHVVGAVAALVLVIVALEWLAPASPSIAARRTPRFVESLTPARQVDQPSASAQVAPLPGETNAASTAEPVPPASEKPTDPQRPGNSNSDSPQAADRPTGAGDRQANQDVGSPDDATVAPAADQPPKSKRIVVAPAGLPESMDHVVSSLAEAARLANSIGAAEIELMWNGPLLSEPLEIGQPRLTLKAAADFQPRILFQPVASQRHMIRLAGGPSARLSLQGVEFYLLASPDAAEGQSLISLAAGQSLELLDSILTVEDPLEHLRPASHPLSMIAVQSRRSGDTMMGADPQPMMSQSTSITFERSIARGQAPLISMPEETPLTLRWQQGLLATSRRLLETAGCETDPKFYEKIVIDLKHVTASCSQGLHHMARAAGNDFQLALDVRSEHCIFLTGSSQPLFSFAALPAGAEDDLRFQCHGDYNCYPDADVVFLRFSFATPGERPQDIEFDDRRWSVESRPQVGNPWLQAPRMDRPLHFLTKEDFLADAALTAGAGFDPQLLPDGTSALPAP